MHCSMYPLAVIQNKKKICYFLQVLKVLISKLLPVYKNQIA